MYKSLVKLGVKEGDTVIVGEVCLWFLIYFSTIFFANDCLCSLLFLFTAT